MHAAIQNGSVALEYRNTLVVNGKSVYEGNWNFWYPHPKGVLAEKRGKMFLNGDTELCDVTPETIWYPHPNSIAVRMGEKLCINGDPHRVWYEGYPDDVKRFDDQVIVNQEHRMLRVTADQKA